MTVNQICARAFHSQSECWISQHTRFEDIIETNRRDCSPTRKIGGVLPVHGPLLMKKKNPSGDGGDGERKQNVAQDFQHHIPGFVRTVIAATNML